MNEKLLKYLGNPISTQILIELDRNNLSAKDLKRLLPNIPTTTLYRYVKQLYSENILEIVEEKPNRGTIEKVYSLINPLKKNDVEKFNQMDTQQYFHKFMAFNFSLITEFSEYSKKVDIDVSKEGTGFSVAPIYATPEELKMYGEAISKILKPALKKQNSEQKLHNFAVIVTPPKEENS